jgi:hypothetical protein
LLVHDRTSVIDRWLNFAVAPKDACRLVVASRWRTICPSCFDAQAELAGVRYQFGGLRARRGAIRRFTFVFEFKSSTEQKYHRQ